MRGQVRLAVAAVAGLLAAAVSGAAGSTAQSGWVITDLGVLVGKPYQFSDAAALNEKSQVVGWSWSSRDVPKIAFVWERVSRPPGSTPRFTWKASPLDTGGLTGESAATGVNDSGQVVGNIGNVGNEQAAYWDNGVANVIETPLGGWGSWAADINQHGVIAGSGFPANQTTQVWKRHGFVWLNGKTTDLGFLPRSNQTRPVALNEHGQVVGSSWSGDMWTATDVRAFLWQAGKKIVDLGALPGRALSAATDIDNKGSVVGSSWNGEMDTSRQEHAFLWSRGRMTDLGPLPGARQSGATGINDNGQIVGWSDDHAVLWEKGRVIDLGTLIKGRACVANAVNNHGQIVGLCTTRNGQDHAVLWTLRSST